jgi:hypothetical protein
MREHRIGKVSRKFPPVKISGTFLSLVLMLVNISAVTVQTGKTTHKLAEPLHSISVTWNSRREN